MFTRRRARRIRKSGAGGLIVVFGALLIGAWVLLSIIHVLGWLILTAGLVGVAYAAGQRRAFDRWLPSRFRMRDTWPLPGRVMETDAVSPYPDELITQQAKADGSTRRQAWQKLRTSSEYGKPAAQRDDLLRDPMSGARPLYRDK